MKFNELFSFTINPNSSVEINKEKRTFSYSIVKVVDNGPSEKKADMLILADGYAKKDLKKLRKDVKHFVNLLFDSTPFKERKKDFNVWSIETISEESGIDKSDKNVWKKTALGTMYNTFGSPRYVLTEENRTIRDISSAVPYDFIVILVNDNRYGGGGIFNLYATCYTIPDTKGQEWQLDYVFVHELGHSFAGLADEYYTSQVSYIDIYPKGVEPWEPNITSLLTQTQIKWKGFVTADTPIPTPWNKSAYDSVEAIKRKLDRLASDYYEKREPLYRAGQNILKSDLYSGKVGAFEGAGYISKGMYRPAIDCRMFSLSLVPFCPICRNAIEQMIDYYVK
jgi:uncharacterized protein YaaR (DUF327 family)